MRHHIFEENSSYPIALLMKASAFLKQELQDNYVTPLMMSGVATKDVIAFTLDYNEVGKAPAGFIKDYLAKLLPALDSIGTKFLYVTDASYFKVLAGQAKADPHFGYVFPCKLKGFEHMQVVLGLNYQQLFYNPPLAAKLEMSLKTLIDASQGKKTILGTGIIHTAHYPERVQEIAHALERLHQYPRLSADIEAFSLRFDQAGLGTISFAWDQHNGIAFPVDYVAYPEGDTKVGTPEYGYQWVNVEVRRLLRRFFETYQGELTFHNATYDVKVLIYTLFMEDLLDTKGLLRGLDIMTRSIQDTKIIAYLAVNSCAGNKLRLKELAHEFAGNWAVDEIKDIRRIPLDKLLQYNLVDALSTNYVKGKYYPVMVADQQEELYKGLMLSSLKLIIQIELTGMPLNPKKVQEVKAKLQAMQQGYLDKIQNSSVIQAMNLLVQTNLMVKANAKLKVKQHPLSKFADEKFNPNSNPQLQQLLYELMGLPVIDLTDTKQPATGGETIEKLINHTSEPAYKELLQALIDYSKVTKILGTFIPAFETAIEKGDGVAWLHGSFVLGGTKSGRLSSKEPNLQQIPAGNSADPLKAKLGKLIKECFEAPQGWIFAGADFNSLEDYISALTTRDPNKLKVYTDGYDGHCLRAFSYFGSEMVGIVDTVDSINSIKKLYPALRQESKPPTFALTYQGTWHTLVSNLGWSKEKAQTIEANFQQLYRVSIQYVQDRLENEAAKLGYITVAFGLRLRTPLLKQVVWGSSKVPYEASAEGRTAGNAMGQSYGLLNNRAAVEFMQKVWASKHRYDIKPVALIHDAIYVVIKDDIEAVEFANRELIKSMQWQELPEIQHPTVKLGAALDIFWPTWASATTLPNDADRETIINICKATREKVLEPA